MCAYQPDFKSANTNKKVDENVMFPNRPKTGVTNRKEKVRPQSEIDKEVEEEEFKKLDMTQIEDDEDFEKKRLYDMDIDQLEKMKDNRRSGYWELTRMMIFKRVLLWLLVVYINEMGFVNPHHDNFIFGSYKIKKFS